MSNKQFKARHGFNTNAASNLASIQISTGNVTVDEGSVVLANGGFYTGNSTVNAAITAGSILINGSVLSPGGAIPGSNTQVMFNDSGSSNAVSSFTYDKSTNILKIGAGTANSHVAQTYIYTANSTAGSTITPGAVSITGPAGTVNINSSYFERIGNTATTAQDYIVLKPSDYGAGKPGLYISKDSTANVWGMTLWDGSGHAGTINITCTTLTHLTNKIWTQGNDGSGSGLDADTLDGYDSAAFARLAGTPSFTSKISITGVGNIAQIANATGSLAQLEIQNNGTGAAAIAFHRTSSYAGYFGLDADNVWRVGGWSYGAVAHTLWHQGNDGSGSGLDADTLDGYQASAFALLSSSPTFTGTVTGSAFNTSSDARLKKKKRKIKETDFIDIDYMSYDMYNKDKEFIGHHYGALAQDVEKTHPHLIDEDEKGFKRLNYTSLHTLEIAKLLNMVKTQNKYIEKLEKRLSKLEGKK